MLGRLRKFGMHAATCRQRRVAMLLYKHAPDEVGLWGRPDPFVLCCFLPGSRGQPTVAIRWPHPAAILPEKTMTTPQAVRVPRSSGVGRSVSDHHTYVQQKRSHRPNATNATNATAPAAHRHHVTRRSSIFGVQFWSGRAGHGQLGASSFGTVSSGCSSNSEHCEADLGQTLGHPLRTPSLRRLTL